MPRYFRTFLRRLPIAPSMELLLRTASLRQSGTLIDNRAIFICGLSIGLAFLSTLLAQLLTHLIGFITNLAFLHRVSLEFVAPSHAPNWGLWVVFVPVLGGITVGFMARYGSKAIRGHGIPEAMEQVLTNQSRIPWRMTFLKPLSAAIAIGTGGPFGAEGPIIATGAALGSGIGQALRTTAFERKILLASGAAAGMTATFGSPVSATLLAIELLLFEFRPRSLIPVALAAAIADAARIPFAGVEPIFKMPGIQMLHGSSIVFYMFLGIVTGFAAVFVTKWIYAVEDGFEKLPIHWMWWPALGGFVVGTIGYFYPNTLGVGYQNIEDIISGNVIPAALGIFCLMKFLSWSIALGSGTSGGTLAPLFTIGGGIGALFGFFGQIYFPNWHISVQGAALVGMAAIFAGASRALLTSVVFAFEVTQQPLGLLPLLSGCTFSFLISCYFMKNSIMTEKIVRRGIKVPSEYVPDYLEQIKVIAYATQPAQTLLADQSVVEARSCLNSSIKTYSHQGFPVINQEGLLVGVVTRKEIFNVSLENNSKIESIIHRNPIVIRDDQSLRNAADLMTRHRIGRLPVVSAADPKQLVGIITRSDLLAAHQERLNESDKH